MARKKSLRVPLHDQVVRNLALRILKGEFTVLPNEADLGKELKVSRSILREAIKVLAGKGMLRVGPKVGTLVRPPTDWNLLDSQLLEWQSQSEMSEHFFANLCELRKILEPHAAELAAQRANKEDILAIQLAWEDMRDNCDRQEESVDNREAFVAADLRFHYAILRASHNELLHQVGGLTRVMLRKSFAIMIRTPSHLLSTTLRHHREILDCIAGGDSAGAKKKMEMVITASAAGLKKRLRSAGGKAQSSAKPHSSKKPRAT